MFQQIWDSIPGKGLVAAALGGTVLAAAALVFGGGAADTASPVTLSQAQALRAADYNLLVTAASIWSPCREQPKLVPYAESNNNTANLAGMYAANYYLAHPVTGNTYAAGRAETDRIRAQFTTDGWNKMLFMALDFEIPDDCYPAFRVSYEFINGALDRMEELGKPRVIYTSYNEWVNHLGDPVAPPRTWLWNANWDNDCTDVDYSRNPYGRNAWLGVALEQCTGGTYVAGVNIDRNIIVQLEDAVQTPTPTPTPTVTPTPTPTPPVITPPSCMCDPCDKTAMWGEELACYNGIVWKSPTRTFLPLIGPRGLWWDAEGHLIFAG